jgi:hypothetical protein
VDVNMYITDVWARLRRPMMHLPELQHWNKDNLDFFSKDYVLVYFLLQNELIASSISICSFVVQTLQSKSTAIMGQRD